MAASSADADTEWRMEDGLRLHVRRWLPTAAPRAVVVVVHGLAEHSGRYAELAVSLNGSELAVVAYDCRGHGRSEGNRAWVESFDLHIDDLMLVLGRVRGEFPGRPLFLFGHSMGGLVVVRAAATRKTDASGLILSAPAVAVDEGLFPWLRKLAAWGGRWFPRLRLVKMGSAMLSRDPQVVAEFKNDPLVFHGRIPTRTGAEILCTAEDMWARTGDVKLPVLILQGSADAVVSPEKVEAFYQAIASGDRTFRRCEGFYHDIPREPGHEAVMNEVAAWIQQRSRQVAAELTEDSKDQPQN